MQNSLHRDAREIVLVTGGAGYIGSHACVELLQAGYQVIIVDNLSKNNKDSLYQLEKITGKSFYFFKNDIRDQIALSNIFSQHSISAVMHFAGLKAVGESCEQPLNYYQNNVHGLMVLVDVMAESNVKKLVFSSSATVYGNNSCVQYSETQPIGATNPYGRTKEIIEKILTDLSTADQLLSAPNPWKISLLRYFNPIGAHKSGLIGENPKGIPNNLMPYLAQVATGKLKQLSIFGNDYPTKDGTGIRDYIHVVDLVKGHIKALEALSTNAYNKGGCKAHNLGSGKGYSVLEVIRTFEKVTGQTINFKFAPRRTGDLAEFYANPSLAADELKWKVEKNLEEMVADTWRWQQQSNQILSK